MDNMINEYTFLEKITKNHIDNFENFLDYEFEDSDEFILFSNSINEIEEEKVFETFSANNFSNNNIVNQLLNSEDESTRNIGMLAKLIEEQIPNYFFESIKLIMENVINENGKLKYIGPTFDIYALNSYFIILKNVLNKENTKNGGREILNHFFNGDTDKEFEFYTYYSFLLPYTKNKNQSKLLEMMNVLNNYFENPETRKEALDNMRKLVILVVNTGLTFSTSKDGSYYYPLINEVCIDDIYSSDKVLLHEFGHAVDNFFFKRNKEKRPKEIFETAKENIKNNPNSVEIIEKINKKISEMHRIADTMYDNTMIEKYGSIENAIDVIEQKIVKKMDAGKLGKLLDKYNVDSDNRSRIMDDYYEGKLDNRKLAESLYRIDKYHHTSKCLNTKIEGGFLDIISAIYGGMIININGKEIQLMFGHSKEYFRSYPDSSMAEIVANLNALIVSGRKDLLDTLKELIGEEIWNYLMNEREVGRIKTTENKRVKKVA